MTDQREIWKRLKPQKMNIPLGVFRFKLSMDQKGIMICLGYAKSQRVLLGKGYYGDEDFIWI